MFDNPEIYGIHGFMKTKESNDKQIAIRIKTSTWEALKKVVGKHGKVSSYIREILEKSTGTNK